MGNNKRDIETGLYLLRAREEIDEIDDKYDYPFVRTNEELESFFKEFPIKDGIVATVAGSGDQQLQAAYFSPEEIHVFDRNPFAIHMSKLKTGAIQALPYDRYIDFFDEESSNKFNVESYRKIRDYLDRETKQFWDKMYLEGSFDRRYGLLIQLGDSTANRGEESFEIEENFYTTKSNLSKIKIIYYFQELFEFFKKLPKGQNFNSIFLSNIYDWLPDDIRSIFAEFIKSEVGKRLLDNGMISVYSSPRFSYYETGLESEFHDSIELKSGDKVLIYKK